MKIELSHWQIATIEVITSALGASLLWAFPGPNNLWQGAGAFIVIWNLLGAMGNLAIHVNRHGWIMNRPKNPDGFGTVDEEERKWRKMLEKP